MWWLRIAMVIRLAPLDTAADEGKSRQRYCWAALSGAKSLLTIGNAARATVLTVLMTLGYLRSELAGSQPNIRMLAPTRSGRPAGHMFLGRGSAHTTVGRVNVGCSRDARSECQRV